MQNIDLKLTQYMRRLKLEQQKHEMTNQGQNKKKSIKAEKQIKEKLKLRKGKYKQKRKVYNWKQLQ